ncbi:type II CAAX endopeptidase family protein [Ascidiimonas aurantiaca]|uniref:CPBP family intramembrane glutamic endopeptidase n=1 Tax=Ascidiimonas aurantiaca TaxID=1685432 RepID=UPI0030EEA1C6
MKSVKNFCPKCGRKLKPNPKTESRALYLVLIFYLLIIGFIAVDTIYFKYNETGLWYEITGNLLFLGLTVLFVLFDRTSVLSLYKIPRSNWKILLFSFLFPLVSAPVVGISIEKLNRFLGYINPNYYMDYTNYEHPVLWSLFFVVILPPLVEELAFRGFLQQQLLKITSPHIAVIGSAFLFAFVHFSIISIVWLFPFGIILGYIRNKYKTLWYGMIIHGIHNLIILAMDYYNYNSLTFSNF